MTQIRQFLPDSISNIELPASGTGARTANFRRMVATPVIPLSTTHGVIQVIAAAVTCRNSIDRARNPTVAQAG